MPHGPDLYVPDYLARALLEEFRGRLAAEIEALPARMAPKLVGLSDVQAEFRRRRAELEVEGSA